MNRAVVYYSLSGNTKEAAKVIARKLGAKIFEIDLLKQNGKMISYSFIFMWWLFNASIILYAVKYGIYRAVIYQFQGMWTNLLAPF